MPGSSITRLAAPDVPTQVDHILVFADEAAAKQALADRIRNNDWMYDHVFPLQIWFSTHEETYTNPRTGEPATRQVPDYDTRYWMNIAWSSLVNPIRASSACVLAYGRDTGEIHKNTVDNLPGASYVNMQGNPRPMGAGYWLGRPNT